VELLFDVFKEMRRITVWEEGRVMLRVRSVGDYVMDVAMRYIRNGWT